MNNVIYYSFCYIVEAIIFWQYCSSLFIPKQSFKRRLAVLCSLYFFIFILSLFELTLLNAILYFSVNFIFLITQYKLNWQLSLFHSTLLTAIMAMCELLVYSIISRFTPHFFSNKDLYNFLTFPVFNKLIFFTIIFILTQFLKHERKYNQRLGKTGFLLIMIPITSIYVMFTLVYIGESSVLSPHLNRMISLSTIFLLAANLLVFGINQYTQKKNLANVCQGLF